MVNVAILPVVCRGSAAAHTSQRVGARLELFPFAWNQLSFWPCRLFEGERDPLRREMLRNEDRGGVPLVGLSRSRRTGTVRRNGKKGDDPADHHPGLLDIMSEVRFVSPDSKAEAGACSAGSHHRLDGRGRGARGFGAVRNADGAALGIDARLPHGSPLAAGLSAHGWRGRKGITWEDSLRRSRVAPAEGKSDDKQGRNGCKDTHGQAPHMTHGSLPQGVAKSSPCGWISHAAFMQPFHGL